MAHLAVQVADFSKTITAYYTERGGIPADFDDTRFFTALETAPHPDLAAVSAVRAGYRVRAQAIPGGYYAVVVCDRATGRKLIEDFNCTTAAVDVRYWDRAGAFPCEFEPNPASYCR